MEWDKFEAIYRDHLKALTESQFAEGGKTQVRLAELRKVMKPVFDRETERATKAAAAAPRGPGFGFGPPGGGNMFVGVPLETFLQKRRESITAQLAGTSQGREPGMTFGPPGGGGFGGPRGDFGPGTFHAPQFMATGDKDSDKKVSTEEFSQLAEHWLSDWDKDKSQSLNLDELTKGLNRALASPAPAGHPVDSARRPVSARNISGQPTAPTGRRRQGLFSHRGRVDQALRSWFPKWDNGQDGQLVEAEIRSGLNAAFAGPAPPAPGRAVPRLR